jgi:hypothetical protein
VPLELVRLGHQRDGDTLLVSGVVRNPAPGSRVDNARVVLTAFNRAGALVSSITGPLDFRTLAPGDESPFMLTLEHADSVGRYRVSFRSAEEILPHVDRREAATAVTERR